MCIHVAITVRCLFVNKHLFNILPFLRNDTRYTNRKSYAISRAISLSMIFIYVVLVIADLLGLLILRSMIYCLKNWLCQSQVIFEVFFLVLFDFKHSCRS